MHCTRLLLLSNHNNAIGNATTDNVNGSGGKIDLRLLHWQVQGGQKRWQRRGAAMGGLPGIVATGVGGAPDNSPDCRRQWMGNDKKESRWWTKMRDDRSSWLKQGLAADRAAGGRCDERQEQGGGGGHSDDVGGNVLAWGDGGRQRKVSRRQTMLRHEVGWTTMASDESGPATPMVSPFTCKIVLFKSTVFLQVPTDFWPNQVHPVSPKMCRGSRSNQNACGQVVGKGRIGRWCPWFLCWPLSLPLIFLFFWLGSWDSHAVCFFAQYIVVMWWHKPRYASNTWTGKLFQITVKAVL